MLNLSDDEAQVPLQRWTTARFVVGGMAIALLEYAEAIGLQVKGTTASYSKTKEMKMMKELMDCRVHPFSRVFEVFLPHQVTLGKRDLNEMRQAPRALSIMCNRATKVTRPCGLVVMASVLQSH